jgi:UDP-N-acetylmuramate--alanine ligase
MPQPGINGKLIVDAVCETPGRPDVYYVPNQYEIPDVLQAVAERGDTVLTMGAGDISRVGDELLGLLAG